MVYDKAEFRENSEASFLRLHGHGCGKITKMITRVNSRILRIHFIHDFRHFPETDDMKLTISLVAIFVKTFDNDK